MRNVQFIDDEVSELAFIVRSRKEVLQILEEKKVIYYHSLEKQNKAFDVFSIPLEDRTKEKELEQGNFEPSEIIALWNLNQCSEGKAPLLVVPSVTKIVLRNTTLENNFDTWNDIIWPRIEDGKKSSLFPSIQSSSSLDKLSFGDHSSVTAYSSRCITGTKGLHLSKQIERVEEMNINPWVDPYLFIATLFHHLITGETLMTEEYMRCLYKKDLFYKYYYAYSGTSYPGGYKANYFGIFDKNEYPDSDVGYGGVVKLAR